MILVCLLFLASLFQEPPLKRTKDEKNMELYVFFLAIRATGSGLFCPVSLLLLALLLLSVLFPLCAVVSVSLFLLFPRRFFAQCHPYCFLLVGIAAVLVLAAPTSASLRCSARCSVLLRHVLCLF